MVLEDFLIRNFEFHPDEEAVRVFITSGRFAFDCNIGTSVVASNE